MYVTTESKIIPMEKTFKAIASGLALTLFVLVGLPLYVIGTVMFILTDNVRNWAER